MCEVFTFFGGAVSTAVCSTIVTIASTVGWAAIAASAIATIISAGGLTIAMASLDALIIQILAIVEASGFAAAVSF